LLVVTLQLSIILLIGLPLVAITQPFVPPLRGAAVLLFVLLLLAFAFWRGATNFQGHTRAAAQALAESLSRQTRKGRAAGTDRNLEEANKIFAGLGSPTPVELQPDSPAIGKTLAEIRLRGLTGATVLAIRRGEKSVLIPSGQEQLKEGDVLAIAGSHQAIQAAKQLLGDQHVAAADPGEL
jgi:CPA2 family monovalent cation:H+ antiporter-2